MDQTTRTPQPMHEPMQHGERACHPGQHQPRSSADLALCCPHHLMYCRNCVGKLSLLHLGTRRALGWTGHSQEARVQLSGSCCSALQMLQTVLHQRLQSTYNVLHFVHQHSLDLSVWVGVWAGCKQHTAAAIIWCCFMAGRRVTW